MINPPQSIFRVVANDVAQSKLRAPRRRDLWLCGLLIFSFCYELPLIEVAPYDRVNPRLFDVALLLALFGTRWKRDKSNIVVRMWEVMTAIFVVVAVISYFFLLPAEYGRYSLFFAAKYVEALLAIWVLTGFRWDRASLSKLFRYFLWGLVFAGTWGFAQFLGILSSERVLPSGAPIVLRPGAILATFGSTYFHSGVIGAMGLALSTTLFLEKRIGLILFSLSALSGAFLTLFSGSRAGLGLGLIFLFIILSRNLRFAAYGLAALIFLAFVPGVSDTLLSKSLTLQRVFNPQENVHNKITTRVTANYLDLIGHTAHFHGPKLFLVGGGFYAVPMPNSDGKVRYRVAYGLHNIHFFTLEQAGLTAFFWAFVFWGICLHRGYVRRRDLLSRCGLSFVVGFVLIGWTGQIFYHGFGTENMVAFQVTALALLLNYSIDRSPGDNGAVESPQTTDSFTQRDDSVRIRNDLASR